MDTDYLPWVDDAACAYTDPEVFFPEKGGTTRDAVRICNTCTVRAQCLDYAIADRIPFGIWGGATQRQIAKLRRKEVG